MVDLKKGREQLEYERARRGVPGQAFERAIPSGKSKKIGGTKENRRRKQSNIKLQKQIERDQLERDQFEREQLSDSDQQLQKRPSLTDFDREFYNALDKKLEIDPAQVTNQFLNAMYSNYAQKVKEGIATQQGLNRLEQIIFKYVDVVPPSMEGMTPKITPKYLGTKKGGRIKKRKNRTKKNYSKGGGVRSANY